ncbi:hypothetical protein PMIN06_012910 [Paraphaeosphaeria minitans]
MGGTTQPPTILTVTPNPHATTVPTTRDPELNPSGKPPKWISGKPPGPSALPSCKGCGLPCVFFCNPACPFCPPGIFPGGGGGGGDPNDPENSSSRFSSTSSGTRTVHNVIFQTADDDVYPDGFADQDALSGLYSFEMSLINSLFPMSTPNPTSKTSSVVPPSQSPPPPSPTAKCDFCDNGAFYTFLVYDIQSIREDDLHKQENGCGALTGWEWGN